MEYSHIFGSQFPNSLIDVGDKKDVDDTVVDLINQYYALMEANDVEGASALYNANIDALSKYKIDMSDWNRLEEDIYNTGLYALKNTTISFADVEPITQDGGSFWYMRY